MTGESVIRSERPCPPVPLGEGDAPERHELEAGSVLVVRPGTALQLSNRGDEELRLFIYGAPPERGEAVFLDPIQ